MSGTAHDAEHWRLHGVRVVRGTELDPNTAQTPGMKRSAAINRARAGAEKLWAGMVTIDPGAKTGAHHHGALESIIYVVKGRARMRWGPKLEFTAEAGPGVVEENSCVGAASVCVGAMKRMTSAATATSSPGRLSVL